MAGVLVDMWPITSEIRGGSYLPLGEIDRICSYFPKSAPFSEAFQKGRWDGVIHMYKNGVVPTGLVPDVLDVLKRHGIPYELRQHWEWPERRYAQWRLNPDVVCRPRHYEAISAIMEAKRGMAQLPTRFGKTTVVASGTIAGFAVPTLFVAHQLDLIYDAKKIFEKFITDVGEIGVIGGGECTYRPLTVACIDSLANKIGDYTMQRYLHDKVKYLIVDETQYYGPGEYKKVINNCQAPYRLFMSATAERNDGADLEIKAASGPMIYELSEEDMIQERYISDVRVEMIPYDHRLFNKNSTGLVYQDFYKAAIVNNMGRNELIVNEVKNLLAEGHPSLIIVKAIDHGHILKEMLINSGITKVEFIWGDINATERIRLRELFNQGEYDVLIGSTVFDTAIDLHRASGLVLAASGNSKIRAPQRVGRVLSQVMGKVAIVKDVKDLNVKWFEEDARDRQQVYTERYGSQRITVRGAAPISDIERKIGINFNKMFDNLGV